MTCSQAGHAWHPILWRWKFGLYQVGLVCLHCPTTIWRDEHGMLRFPVNRISELQHRWWLDRIEGRPVTPWLASLRAPPDTLGSGPFGRTLLPDELPWPVREAQDHPQTRPSP